MRKASSAALLKNRIEFRKQNPVQTKLQKGVNHFSKGKHFLRMATYSAKRLLAAGSN